MRLGLSQNPFVTLTISWRITSPTHQLFRYDTVPQLSKRQDWLAIMHKLRILVKIILIACSSAEDGWEWQYDMNSPTSENLISGQRQKKMSWGNQSCSMSRLPQRPQRYQHRRSDLFYKWSGMDSLFLDDYLGLLSRPLNGNNKCSRPYPLFQKVHINALI